MAEAIAAVGIIASFIQLTEFSIKLAHRVHSFTTATNSAPDSLRHVAVELPALLEALKKSAQILSGENLTEEARCALEAPIKECAGEIEALNKIFLKVLPDPGNKKGTRIWKGVWSLRYDAKIKNKMAVVRGYVQTLSYYHVTVLSSKSMSVKALPKPLPTSTVPYHRNPGYVDSGTLREVRERMNMPASRLALVGMGGVGKTQLALEYAHQIREKYPETWVFWINAATSTTFKEGCHKIVKAIKTPGWDDPKSNTLELARTWLCDERNEPWLLILDNLDDPTNPGYQYLVDIPSRTRNGSILMTSRWLGDTNHLKLKANEVINLQPMTQDSAILLLSREAGIAIDPDSPIAADLVQKLQYLPLAISQMAAYLRLNPQMTMQEYGNKLEETWSEFSSPLQDLRNAGVVTWTISMEQIRKERPSAACLMSLMSVTDRHSIPDSFLEAQYKNKNSLRELSGSSDGTKDLLNEEKFDRDISLLMAYYLVAMNKKDEFEMHQDVRSATRKLLESGNEVKRRNTKPITINPIKPTLEDLPASKKKQLDQSNASSTSDFHPPSELVQMMRLEMKMLERKLLLMEYILLCLVIFCFLFIMRFFDR